MLNIEGAIAHAREKAAECRGSDAEQGAEACAQDHEQLASWLEELVALRARVPDMEQELADLRGAVLEVQQATEDAEEVPFRVTPEDAIRVLNEALEADPECVLALMEYRVPCNDILADHETIQVRSIEGLDPNVTDSTGSLPTKTCEVGLLGIINGILGAYPPGHSKAGWEPLCAEYAKAEGPITRFRWVVSPDEEPLVPQIREP